MASFFGKARASPTTTSPSKGPTPSTSNTLSELDRGFRPFTLNTLEKDAELAPVNWIQGAKGKKRNADVEVIVIDEGDAGDHDVEMSEPEPTPNAITSGNIHFHIQMIAVINMVTLEYIRHVLSRYPSLPTGSCSSDTICPLMTRLSEAEVFRDTAAVRALLSHPQDRTWIPAKVFIFHEDERPGSFTRGLRLVKPRGPFARDDIALDYTYDSGAEWGEEDEDDVLGDSDDEQDDEEESDNLDGWLVDGDEEEVATPVDEREGLDAFPFPPIRKQQAQAQSWERAGDGYQW